jgi:hypothetical protein
MTHTESLIVAAFCKEVYPLLTDGQMAAISHSVRFFPDTEFAKETLLEMIRLNSERLNIGVFVEKLHTELRRRNEAKVRAEKAHERAIGQEAITRSQAIAESIAKMPATVLAERLRQGLATLKPDAAAFLSKHDVRNSPFLQALIFDTDQMVRAFE